jgi:TetR/AcrR family transcriptional regulator, transcriptional repressor of bet genes
MPKVGMAPVRRAQIIKAVIECVAEQGLEALTMDAVVKRAGVSEGVVDYYFAGKRDLFLQAFEAFLESYNRQIVELVWPEMGAVEMMEIVIDVCFPHGEVVLPLRENDPTYSIDQLGKVFLHFLTKTVLDNDFRKVYQKVYDTYLEGMKSIIQQGNNSGEIRRVDPDEAAYSVMALIEGMVMYRNTGFQPLPPQTQRMMCKDFAPRYLCNR